MNVNETTTEPTNETQPAPASAEDAGDAAPTGQPAGTQPLGEPSPGAFHVADDFRALKLLKDQIARQRRAKGRRR